jgi:hypothetical protein
MGVTGFFELPNPSHTMVLGWSQPLRERSTWNLLGGIQGLPAHKADNLTAICELNVWGEKPQRFTTLLAFMACYRDSFTFNIQYDSTCN